jgi:hypothetical protein
LRIGSPGVQEDFADLAKVQVDPHAPGPATSTRPGETKEDDPV